VRDARVLHQVPDRPPAQPPEERDVGRLDEGFHLPAAQPARRGDREPDERGAEAEMTVAGQDGQPVALPPAGRLERVEPDRPADVPAGQADDVDRCRVVVAGVRVVAVARRIPAAEQPLLDDEDLMPDPEVRAPLGRGGHGPAGQQPLPRLPRPPGLGGRASGC